MPPVVAVVGPHRPSKDGSRGHYHHCRGGGRRRPDLTGIHRGQENGSKTRSGGSSSPRVLIDPELEEVQETRLGAGHDPDPSAHRPPQQRAKTTRKATSSTKAAAVTGKKNDGQEHQHQHQHQQEQDGTEERGATPTPVAAAAAAATSCLPSSILAGIRVKDSSIATRRGAPGWGCFYPVVLPPKMTSIRDNIYPNFANAPEGSGGGGGGGSGLDHEHSCRAEMAAGYSLKAPEGFSRARQQAVNLSAALQHMLEEARSRGGRRRLSEATSVSAAAGPAQVLHLSSGAQTGLTIISALEDIVAEEGEVFNSCFCEVVRQERRACRQRGRLVETMREYYAALVEDVVKHLSRLRLSLQAMVSQELLLKQQAHRVKRLAKLLEEDSNANEEARRKLASLELTDLERFLAARHDTIDKRGNIAVSASVANDCNKTLAENDDADEENNAISNEKCSNSNSSSSSSSRSSRSGHSSRFGDCKGGTYSDSCKGDDRRSGGGGGGDGIGGSENNESNNAEQRRSAESLLGVLSEVQSEQAVAVVGIAGVVGAAVGVAGIATEPALEAVAVRHVRTPAKVVILQKMLDERALLRRVQDRWENWRRYDAATFIRDWWRKHHPAEWEEGDRQYAATLLQAHVRGKLATLLRKRMAEAAAHARGATALQNMFRRFRAVRERKRRARVFQLALGASLRTIGQAMSELEDTVSALAEGGHRSSQNDAATVARDGAIRRSARPAAGSPSALSSSSSPPPRRLDEEGLIATAGPTVAGGGAVAGADETENTKNSNIVSVSSLVERLKSLGQVLEQREELRGGGGVRLEDFGGNDGRSGRGRTGAGEGRGGGGGSSSSARGGRRIARSRLRRHQGGIGDRGLVV